MTAFNFHRRRTRRWWYAGVTLVAAAFFAVFYVAGSSADNAGGCDFFNGSTNLCSGPLSGSTFAGGDGNLLTSPTTYGSPDWQNVAGLNHGIDLASGGGDNSFGNGTKEDNPNVTVVSGSIPPNKSDLTRFYEASEFASNSNFLYLAWERSNVLGSANMDFEINQQATPGLGTPGPHTINRTAGDLLITFDFTNGGGKPTLGLLKWVTSGSTSQCFSSNALPCWGNHVTLNGTNSIGAVNTDPVTDPLFPNEGNYINPVPALQFGETAINLTGAGVFPPGTCEAFGSAFLKSRASASFPAEVKDFIAPIPVNISNCGTIRIHKVTQNGDNTFNYSTTGGLSPSTFTLSNGGTQSFQGENKIPPGNYSVTEGSEPPNWTFVSLNCTATGSGTSATTSGTTASIVMQPDGVVDCTYTNKTKKQPAISTSASGPVIVGNPIHDIATLSGGTSDIGGSITFHLYPSLADCQAGTNQSYTNTVTVNGNGDYNSGDFTPTAAGTYFWTAVYSGDANNQGASTACGDANESSVVNKQSPAIVTHASGPVIVGNPIHDVATLSGGFNPTGSITFHLYPSLADCQAGTNQSYTNTVTVNGNGDYNSGDFTPTAAGTYFWTAVYSGDGNNQAASTACGDANESSVVNKQSPAIVTHASGPVIVGNPIHDVATLSGGFNPTGSITFKLYPSLADCQAGSNVLYSNSVTVNGNGDYNSGNFTPTAVGTYYWTAAYSGDGNNQAASTACGDANEASVVNPPQTAISTNAISPVTIGDPIFDIATLSGGFNPTGSITFHLYPSLADCQAGTNQSYTNTVTVNGNGDYNSGNFTPTAVGTYYWTAVYSGDANNLGASTACGDANESSVVNKAPSTIATAQSVEPNDSATLSAGAGGTPTGTVHFKLFGPGDPTCSGSPVYSQDVTLDSNGMASTDNESFSIAAAASDDYKWLVVYDGDATHDGATSACGTEHFTLTIVNQPVVSPTHQQLAFNHR
jgi:hypothetical protein